MLSSDGLIRPEVAEAVKRVLSVTVEAALLSHLDLKKTYTNQFIDARLDRDPTGK